jgi:hypothetical protein
LEKVSLFYSRDAEYKKNHMSATCPFLPFDDDFQTSGFGTGWAQNVNNVEVCLIAKCTLRS